MSCNPLTKTQLVSGDIKKPSWMKLKIAQPGLRYKKIRSLSEKLKLATVCASAMCPNIGECWGCGTATFMIMGGTCTRACRFCNVNHGKPGPLDENEPKNLARAIKTLGLDYAVITSVDRDDLKDAGSAHFAACIKALRKSCPKLIIEVLTPDFCGVKENIELVARAGAHVFGHNVETVKRLQKSVRDFRANYKQSLFVLEYAKKITPKIQTKSSIMVGLGEKPEEVLEAMKDLRAAKVDFLTIGQYLRPTAWNLKVVEYVTPEQFEWYHKEGLKLGFKYVAAGPFVRSSYKAGKFYKNLCK